MPSRNHIGWSLISPSGWVDQNLQAAAATSPRRPTQPLQPANKFKLGPAHFHSRQSQKMYCSHYFPQKSFQECQ